LPQTTEPRYLRTAQVAELLQVSPKTVSRWAQEGMLPYFRTLGGHRRYPDREIRALLETLSEPSSAGYPRASPDGPGTTVVRGFAGRSGSSSARSGSCRTGTRATSSVRETIR
jgi:excisionase family DNA binding protein